MIRTPLTIAATATAIVLASTTLTPSAYAASPTAFSYQAYEVETDGGASALYARMKRQASSHCRANTVRFAKANSVRACANDLMESWVADTGSRRLQQLHTSRLSTHAFASN